MDPSALLMQLERNALRIQHLVEGASPEQARWKPDPKSWSILEVVCHLLDEEREDFRVRLNIILHEPARDWPPIDPAGWVTSRAYNSRELGPSLLEFLAERRASLAWLRGLGQPDWEASVTTRFGSMRAGDMFASWTAHDQLHMRQFVELHRAWLVEQARPYDVRYAGEW
jgi:hypothetical protein